MWNNNYFSLAPAPAPAADATPPAVPVTDVATPKPSSSRANSEEDIKSQLPLLSESLVLDSLWETLSACLLELEHTPDHHAVLVLQPAVEAFFLVHSSSSPSRGERNNDNAAENLDVAADIAPVSPIYSDNESASQGEAATASGATTAAAPVTHAPHTWDVNAAPVQKVLPPDQLKFLKFAGKLI